MLVRLRRDRANFALPGLQLALLAVIVDTDSATARAVLLAMLLASGLYGWLRSIQHARLIDDTPTARIASAAQGYGELRGQGRPLGGTPLLSPVNGLPVLWYRVSHYQKQGDAWEHVSTTTSDASFLLDDGSGVCAVDPEGAEMLVQRRDVYEDEHIRNEQWSLIERDPIYVIGDFATLGSISPEFDTAAQVRELLAHWKEDRQALLARFDLDGDGQIDVREWELARAQARREVLKARQGVLDAPEAHVMRRPQDRRLYLISDLDPRRIARRYRLWSGFHLLLFLGAAAALAALRQLGAG